jgi:tryptophan-rich hypothetical protein
VNRINPQKLLQSKWTAVNPLNREKHFVVTDVRYTESGDVESCVLEAVLTRRSEAILWELLKSDKKWTRGWK